MSCWELLLLSFIQGLTEFLPVSSSGHLRLVESLLGYAEPETLLDVSMHVGTLLAVVFFFRRDILDILKGFGRVRLALQEGRELSCVLEDPGVRFLLLLVVATLPLLPIGFLFADSMENAAASLSTLAWFFVANGVIVLSSRLIRIPFVPPRLNKGPLGMGFLDALIIGLGQCVGLFRGISRSGSTISVALMLGFDRKDAATFSFLMSIPAILGALVLSAGKAAGSGAGLGQLLFAGMAAGVFGLGALHLLMKVLKSDRFHLFGVYTILLGVLILVWERMN